MLDAVDEIADVVQEAGDFHKLGLVFAVAEFG